MEASAQQVLFTQASNPSQDLPHLIHHDENDMAPQCDTPVVPCIIDHGARCISSTGIQETSASALIVTAAGSHDDIEKDVDGEVDHDEDSAVIAAQEEALDDNKEKEENNNEIMNQGPSMNSSARVLSPRQAQALASQQRRAQLQAIMAPFFEVQHMTDPIVRSRCEKRMLKMVAKKGGHEVTGIYRVTWKTRRDGEMIHCIDNPQVFKFFPDVYVVTGEERLICPHENGLDYHEGVIKQLREKKEMEREDQDARDSSDNGSAEDKVELAEEEQP